MQLEYPYQIVSFLGKEPRVNEPVYYGNNGWYPQIALKRRFKLTDGTEEQLIELLKSFANQLSEMSVSTGLLIKPERMPVRVIDVNNQNEFMQVHQNLIAALNNTTVSRYPERENGNYYAHITAEHNDTLILNPDDYTNRQFALNNIWLLKDTVDENSVAYIKIK